MFKCCCILKVEGDNGSLEPFIRALLPLIKALLPNTTLWDRISIHGFWEDTLRPLWWGKDKLGGGNYDKQRRVRKMGNDRDLQGRYFMTFQILPKN